MIKIRKSLMVACVSIISSVFLTGCVETPERVEVEQNLPSITIDSVKGNKLDLSHDIEGFKFKTVYETGRYDFSKWRVTDTKSLKMSATIEGLPEGTEVMIEHVHTDISLKSTSPQLDGLFQDSMDDSYHGVGQDGFPITSKYGYENIFAIEGFSKDLMEGWSYYCGEYGSISAMTSRRLSERNLISEGVYANKLQVVYDVMIKHKGEDKYHVKSIVDELLIPIIRPTVPQQQTK